MGKEQNSAYYDKIYRTSTEYAKPWQESRYRKVWERMIQRFDKDKPVHDLGCGVGQVAQMLLHEGFKEYYGVDFSQDAIEKAKSLFPDSSPTMFRCIDVFKYIENCKNPEIYEPKSQQFFCSETLEHISDDTGLLSLLAQKFPGSPVAISVPTFDDPSHVRHFKSAAEAKLRYGKFLTNIDVSQIGPWIIIQGKFANQL
jgi:trans-aconitate methyltransferase